MKKQNSLDNLLAEPVNVKSLIEQLDFSEENIMVANREQPSLFLEASRYRVKKMRSRIQAEAVLESEKANAALFLRKKKIGRDSGITEGYIRDKVAVHPKVEEARTKFDNCQVHEEWAKLLLEAYRQRRDAIRTLAELLGAEANAQARAARKDAEMAGFENLKRDIRKKYRNRGDDGESS